MFSYFSRFAYRFQDQPLRTAAMAALAILVLAIMLASVGRWLRRRRQDQPDRWPALVTGSLGAVLKVLIGLAVLALLAGMLIAGVVMTALVAMLQFICNRGPAAWATVILFILFCMVYPLVRISSCEGLLMSVIYTLLLAYTIVLIVRRTRAVPPTVAAPCA